MGPPTLFQIATPIICVLAVLIYFVRIRPQQPRREVIRPTPEGPFTKLNGSWAGQMPYRRGTIAILVRDIAGCPDPNQVGRIAELAEHISTLDRVAAKFARDNDADHKIVGETLDLDGVKFLDKAGGLTLHFVCEGDHGARSVLVDVFDGRPTDFLVVE